MSTMGFKRLCSASIRSNGVQLHTTQSSQKMKALISFMQVEISI